MPRGESEDAADASRRVRGPQFIAAKTSQNGARPKRTPRRYEVVEYTPLLDSADMVPADWCRMATDIAAAHEHYDGFVIIMGTDTMAYFRGVDDIRRDRGGAAAVDVPWRRVAETTPRLWIYQRTRVAATTPRLWIYQRTRVAATPRPRRGSLRGDEPRRRSLCSARPAHARRYVACWQGHADLAALLLDRGAKIDLTCDGCWTPLYAACENGHVDLARILIDRGANATEARRLLDDEASPLFDACLSGKLAGGASGT